MGAFDQAARFAAQADPEAVVRRVLVPTGLSLSFRGWLDTRTIPLPGGPDRTADLVAALDDPKVGSPWLLIFEFQAQHDPNKLDVLLEETAVLRGHVRHGDDRKGKFRVSTALIYLQGRCPDDILDMTLPGGYGIRHAPLVWNVAQDDAATVLEIVASGGASWGLLFWVPLMSDGGEDTVIERWKDVAENVVPNRRDRDNLVGIALVFAELAGRVPAWRRGLEGTMWTESQVVNEWISQGLAEGRLEQQRRDLLRLLRGRFPGSVPEDIVTLIRRQDSLEILEEWFDAAINATTFEQFLVILIR